jgi:hypothetical protein
LTGANYGNPVIAFESIACKQRGQPDITRAFAFKRRRRDTFVETIVPSRQKVRRTGTFRQSCGGTKKTTTEHSDIDLAVSGIPPEKFYEAMGDTFGAIRQEIDIIDPDEKSSFVDYLRTHGELHRVE